MKTLNTARLWQLFTPYPGEAPASKVDFAKLYGEFGVYRADAKATPGIIQPDGIKKGAANARIHSAKGQFHGETKLKTGQNDAFLTSGLAKGFTRDISDWCTSLGTIGGTLPRMPFVVPGRTPKVAWGFTKTGPDVGDLYLEQINPANPKQYRVPETTAGGQAVSADFKTRIETIKVKGQSSVQLAMRESATGPF